MTSPDFFIQHEGRHYLVDGTTQTTLFHSRLRVVVRLAAWVLRRSPLDFGDA
jgi:hypothetical protein